MTPISNPLVPLLCGVLFILALVLLRESSLSRWYDRENAWALLCFGGIFLVVAAAGAVDRWGARERIDGTVMSSTYHPAGQGGPAYWIEIKGDTGGYFAGIAPFSQSPVLDSLRPGDSITVFYTSWDKAIRQLTFDDRTGVPRTLVRSSVSGATVFCLMFFAFPFFCAAAYVAAAGRTLRKSQLTPFYEEL